MCVCVCMCVMWVTQLYGVKFKLFMEHFCF